MQEKYQCSEEEIWKDIKGYEGYYQVSNLGRIKSLSRISIMKNGVRRKKEGRILSSSFDGKKRYLQVNLSKNGKKRIYQVHTLVGRAFVKGYFQGAEIDHIDTVSINNRADNLRWTNRSGNMRNTKTHIKTVKHHIEKQRIPVIGTNIKNGYILYFPFVRAAKRNGFKGIGENIHGRCKQCHGYVWRYANGV